MSGGGNTVPDWLGRRADGMAGALAVIGKDGDAWSFAELNGRAVLLAARLRRLGVGEDSRVAVLMGNSRRYVEVVHALIKLGATLVPLNTRLTPVELAWQLRDVRADLLLHDDRNREVAAAAHDGVAVPRWGIGDGIADGPLDDVEPGGAPEERPIDLDRTHSIIYTSGTTGQPKGVRLTYGNHWWSAIGSALNLGLHAGDRWLAVLPLFHVGGLAILLRGVIYGIPVMVHERFDPSVVNLAIDRQAITIVSVVATMLERLLEERRERPFPATLRAVLLGGGPAPRPLLERCARLSVPVIQTYGMTETASQAATLAPADALRKLGSAGKPLLPLEIGIRHDRREAPPLTPGEIVVRGPSVTPGYDARPEATAAAIRDGWLHTGDLGYLDEEGYLFVLDRRTDLIISGGENVYPAEVEAALLAHPGVTDAGVIGVSDPAWGQRAAAVVVLQPRAVITSEQLIDFCRMRLAGYKVPVEIRFRPELPRNAAGKLMRHALRESWTGA